MILNISCDIFIGKIQFLSLNKVPFYFSIKPVPHEFKHDIRITIDTRALSLKRQFLKDLINICHVKVSTETEILCLPVISSKKRMYIRDSAFACCTIPKMSHIQLTSKR